MSVQAVARRYASALADVVLARNEAREAQDELKIWDEMLQSNPNLREVFANPTVALDQKRAVLNRLIKSARPRPTTANFLKVLRHNHRLTELAEINRRYAQALEDRPGPVAPPRTPA